MSILDKLRRKKEDAKPEAAKKESPAVEAVVPVKKPAAATAKAYATSNIAQQILVRPILSEKGTHLASRGKYVFAVSTGANKSEIKKTVQAIYDVHVRDVRVMNISGKKRRYGKGHGVTNKWRKAIVTVRAGEQIPGIIESVG